jgi:hypothetical protein
MMPMPHSDNPISTGLEMWHDNVLSYGIEEAFTISRNYLDMNLKREHSREERQFCRELFAAMFEATASRVDPNKLVYPYSLETAEERTESSYYSSYRMKNTQCAYGIDSLISDSCYKSNFYNYEIAALRAIQDYGFPRICMVLAFNYRNKENDARFTSANKRWASEFPIQEKAFNDAWLQSHAILIDSFCDCVRKLYLELNAERFALPGNEEHGEFVGGVEIKRAITTSNAGNGFSTGFAIGHNPEAVSPWVCWQFAVREDKRHYYWGIYGEAEQTAIDAYNARVFVALN